MFSTQTISWAGHVATAPASRAAAPRHRAGRSPRPSLRARYEGAIPDDATEHWKFADTMSAKAANSRGVREELRRRCRYEAQNNSMFSGMLTTLANDIIGTGPSLQILLEDDGMNQLVEGFFAEWFHEVCMVRKLRTVVKAKKTDGEGIFLKKYDPGLQTPVKLFPQDIECDQMATADPSSVYGDRFWVDGMELDELGRPVVYHILVQHPGDFNGLAAVMLKHDRVAARYVCHWFKKDRPGQCRGIPEITPSLNDIAQLRRYDRATLTAAEWAATMSALLFTKMDPGESDEDEGAPLGSRWESFQTEPGLLTVLPEGYEPKQLQATQPTATYKEFRRVRVASSARPLGMPYNVAAADSADMNFSSGRLDHLPYDRGVDIERSECEEVILEPMFAAWWAEAVLIPGYLPEEIRQQYPLARMLPRTWHWPPMDSIDPIKDAQADKENLANGTTSQPELCARYGKDWRVVMRQRAQKKKQELDLAKEFGLPLDWDSPAKAAVPAADPVENETETEQEAAV